MGAPASLPVAARSPAPATSTAHRPLLQTPSLAEMGSTGVPAGCRAERGSATSGAHHPLLASVIARANDVAGSARQAGTEAGATQIPERSAAAATSGEH